MWAEEEGAASSAQAQALGGNNKTVRFILYSRWAAVEQFVSQPKVDRTNPQHFCAHVYTAAIGIRRGSEGGPEVPYAFCNIFKFTAVF